MNPLKPSGDTAAKPTHGRTPTQTPQDGTSAQLPVMTAPRDVMQQGFASLEADARPAHPVQVIQAKAKKTEWAMRLDTVERLYGSAAAMRLNCEKEAVSKQLRLPGLPSSMLGLETVMGQDTDLDFSDYLNLPTDAPEAAVSSFQVHSAMEMKLGLL